MGRFPRLVDHWGHDVDWSVWTVPQSSPTLPRRGRSNRSLLVALCCGLSIPLLVLHTADSLSLPGDRLAPLHAQESWHRREHAAVLLTSSAASANGITARRRLLRHQARLGRPRPERPDART